MLNDTSKWLNQNFRYKVFSLFLYKERKFYRFLIVLFVVAGIAYPYPDLAMWLAFMFAGYSAIANDSIQTIGTFLASNAKRPWWMLWLFIAGIFAATVIYSWYTYNGDVSYDRLSSKGFSEAPREFQFLQLAAPLVLLFLTRMKMPVSTTFMCLSAYSADISGIQGMMMKSVIGYGSSFLLAILVWFLLAKYIKRLTTGEAHPAYTVAQWITSGMLWSVWIMQDGANIAVTLPRSLTFTQLMFYTGYIVLGLGLLFYLRGDKIQQIITEKSQVSDVRGATVIDFIYTIILFVFKELSNIPMSTTWVFIGLMAGREMAMTLAKDYGTKRTVPQTLRLIRKDLIYATIGLVISIIIAILVNPTIQNQLKAYF